MRFIRPFLLLLLVCWVLDCRFGCAFTLLLLFFVWNECDSNSMYALLYIQTCVYVCNHK